jgi:NADH:ubiquinone oxidoreductase subunit F (NADH-binding)
LVSNTETFANVPGIVARGAEWFRSVGTPDSPGTIVCTITGATARDGVAEVAMGTPLREAIEVIGGGAQPGRRIIAAMSGVANAVVDETNLDVPLSYESLAEIGSGLGAAGFLVFDDATDLAAVAAGAARFLAVESCGQCTRCKEDGLAIAARLARLAGSEGNELDLEQTHALLDTVAEGARCNLAYQQQLVVGSILSQFAPEIDAHVNGLAPGREPALIAAIATLEDDHAAPDETQPRKQPDWTYNDEDSGQWPADRLDDHRREIEL